MNDDDELLTPTEFAAAFAAAMRKHGYPVTINPDEDGARVDIFAAPSPN